MITGNFHLLSNAWKSVSHTSRKEVTQLLKMGKQLHDMPKWWRRMLYTERMDVLHWLRSTNQLTAEEFDSLKRPEFRNQEDEKFATREIAQRYRRDHPNIVTVWDRSDRTSQYAICPMPHHGPSNGGTRILPLHYRNLTDKWLRANGEEVKIEEMNDGHLENSIKLIVESHKNLIARIQWELGTLHAYLESWHHQDSIESMSKFVDTMDVEHVYPIFKVMTRELFRRKQTKRTQEIDRLKKELEQLVSDEITDLYLGPQ